MTAATGVYLFLLAASAILATFCGYKGYKGLILKRAIVKWRPMRLFKMDGEAPEPIESKELSGWKAQAWGAAYAFLALLFCAGFFGTIYLLLA